LFGATTAATGAAAANRNTPEVIAPNLPAGQRAGVPRILGVERYGAKDSARIVVLVSEPATYRAGLLRAEESGVGARLYVDIDRAETEGSSVYPVGGLVQRVRLGKHADGVRLVLDLEDAVERRVFYMPEPFRLVIDVARGTTGAMLRSTGPRVLERVVIDPGHGGHDPGAIGPRGLREKDVTLDIAHRTAPLIARELGLSTLLTRDTDAYVALDERTARANAFRADLFVSIHCNAAEQTGSDGVMSFVLDTSSDAAASRVAALENAASAAAAKELASSLGPAQDEGILARSLHFADLLQRSTVASLSKDYGRIQNQGVRRAGFYVLAGAHMPAVLYEVSFISNPDGEVRLNTADYRQRLADSIVNAVRAFRDGL
jgi:N-acetylmuramoyl-L-alanine amidase